MKFKVFILIALFSFSISSTNAQDSWSILNAGFQEYFAQGKFETALKKAEKEFEYASNNDVPRYQLAFSCSDVGITLYALKRYEEAEKYLLMSVEHNLVMSGKESDNTLSELNQLALNYAALNENIKSDSLLRIVIEVREKTTRKRKRYYY